MKKNKIDIALASDSNYLSLASVAIMSLLSHNFGDCIEIHLLCNNINLSEKEKLRSYVSSKSSKISFYDIDNLHELLEVKVPNTIALTSYARLFISDILPKHINRVLYIDCDTMFTDSIAKIVDFELNEYLVGGVLDPILGLSYKREIDIPNNEPYLNAGVLLIPLDRWRMENMTKKFLDYLIKNNGKVHHHDQGIINAVCSKRKKILPPEFNVMSNCFSYGYNHINSSLNEYYSEEMFTNAIEHPIIIHFTGADLGRPWTTDCKHPLRLEYNSYFLNNPIRSEELLNGKTSKMISLEMYLFRILPFPLFRFLMRSINNIAYIKHRLNYDR